MPDQLVPDHDVPFQTALDQLVPDQEVPDHDVPDQLVPLQEVPDQLVPLQEVPDQLVPDHDVPFQSPPDHAEAAADDAAQAVGSHALPKMSISPTSGVVSSPRTVEDRAPCRLPIPVPYVASCTD